LQSENFQNVSEVHGKQLRFWIHKFKKYTQNFFLQSVQGENLKNAPELHSQRFIFEHINRGIAPRTFSVNLAGRELSKCV